MTLYCTDEDGSCENFLFTLRVCFCFCFCIKKTPQKRQNEWQTEYRGHKYICLSIRNALTESFRSFPFSFSFAICVRVFVYIYMCRFYSVPFYISDILASNYIRLSISFDILFVCTGTGFHFVVTSTWPSRSMHVCILFFFSLVFAFFLENILATWGFFFVAFVSYIICAFENVFKHTATTKRTIIVEIVFHSARQTRWANCAFQPCLFRWIINISFIVFDTKSFFGLIHIRISCVSFFWCQFWFFPNSIFSRFWIFFRFQIFLNPIFLEIRIFCTITPKYHSPPENTWIMCLKAIFMPIYLNGIYFMKAIKKRGEQSFGNNIRNT